MSTSGTITFNQTRDQIITDALSLLNIVAEGEAVTTAALALGSNYLNKLVKAWEGQGIHLWTESEGTLYLIKGQTTYILAASGGANASDGTGTPVETTVAVLAGAGSNTVNATTTTGMTIGDNVGVVQDNQVVFWTTIIAINNTVLTLNSPTLFQASAANGLFTYKNVCPRVLSVQGARCRDLNLFDRQMVMLARKDYQMIPQKFQTGTPIIAYYSPQMNNGLLYLWPAPDDVNKRIEFTYLRAIQDFNTGTDNPDLPQEWLLALTYNLAVLLAPAYGINLSSSGISGNPSLMTQAAQYLQDMKAWDADQGVLQLVPPYDLR